MNQILPFNYLFQKENLTQESNKSSISINLMNSFFVNQSLIESKNSLYQSGSTLTELAFNNNIMIREKFPSVFKKSFWDQISYTQPEQFLFKQNKILQILLNDQDKFLTLFNQFYQNHKKIYNWYVLANQKHNLIKEYVFGKLLKKSLADYKVELKNNLAKKSKKLLTKDEKQLIQSKNYRISSNNSPRKKTFPHEKTENSSNNSMHKSVTFFSDQQNLCQNYYDLFMKTLDACEGSKYIHYDFRRHQKGYQSKSLYNNFIRCKNSDNQNENQQKIYKKITGFKQNLTNSHQKLPNKMISVFKQKKPYFSSHESLSMLEMRFFESENDENSKIKKSRDFTKKYSKKLVLKKMPHRFGNPKQSV